ncbi:MAG TPA: aldo/keto reductase [Steroidobacteraceae bacterium]|jgi:aryl-alcohol dehydrogenase-like predicted oxidoreductase|nr:aldo/keto reductase [Steroidobacteraceae bacterium]
MQTRLFAKTGERVSALGFGCMGLVGWYGERNDAEARATLLAALDSGINHLDTAASYQVGENEKFVGATIRGRRNEVFLATKFGIEWRNGTLVIDNKPESIVASCEASLARLGTDHIDLFYLHRIDRTVPIEESVGTLAKLVAAGKIRYVGLSEASAETLRRACKVHPIAALQIEYSLWWREPERAYLPTCRELGIAVVAYSPLGRGFLAGNFRSLNELPPNDARRNQPRFVDANIAHNQQIADAVRALAARKGCTPAQIALAWLFAQGDDIFPIPGTKRRDRLAENVGSLDVKLSPEELAELNAKVSELGVQGERYPPAMMSALDG